RTSFLLTCSLLPPLLHSFPTRRSSDLAIVPLEPGVLLCGTERIEAPIYQLKEYRPVSHPELVNEGHQVFAADCTDWRTCVVNRQDRKSTRLNSSHRTISYAVFCLKKKT